jgi:hypothetical protein
MLKMAKDELHGRYYRAFEKGCFEGAICIRVISPTRFYLSDCYHEAEASGTYSYEYGTPRYITDPSILLYNRFR